MDEDKMPSEDEDSAATDPREEHVVATLDMDRQLDPDFKWVCVGKHKDDPDERAVFLTNDEWDADELRGFIENAVNPPFVIQALNQRGQ